jgi:hypothetical protein
LASQSFFETDKLYGSRTWRKAFAAKQRGLSMTNTRRSFKFHRWCANIFGVAEKQRIDNLPILIAGVCFSLLGPIGCGQSAHAVASSATGQVDSYFGSPFSVSGSDLGKSNSTFDHVANQITVSALLSTQTAQVPTEVINATFSAANTGFLSVKENFATNGSGALVAENPPVTGAWSVEIPGAGALANFLSLHGTGGASASSAAPMAMADSTACPSFSSATPFLYVTAPKTNLTGDTADYGEAKISVAGSDVTINATPFLVGDVAGSSSTVTGGCSSTNFGALTAYPLNSFGSASNLDLISIGSSGLLVSSFSNGGSSPGAFGGGTGVIGVAEPSAPVNISAVTGAKYNGFVYDPQNLVQQSYDITTLAASFGNHSVTSSACSALQSSLVANNGQGAKTVAVLPSANTIYGGEFLTGTGSAAVNDPTGAIGSENCDTAIDLGSEDSTNHGLFPNATVFVGSNFPPYSSSSAWICPQTGTVCAVSFPAAAIVGQIKGQYVIFLVASAGSTPASQLPDTSGLRQPQPIGIYLFQNSN